MKMDSVNKIFQGAKSVFAIGLISIVIASCGGSGGDSSESDRVSSPQVGSFTKIASDISATINVDAGLSQVSDPNLLVPLTGVANVSGAEGSVQYEWTQIDGPVAFILNPFLSTTSILVPDVSEPTVMHFRLSATLFKSGESTGITNSDTMSIIINPLIDPVRVIGEVQGELQEQVSFKVTLDEPAESPIVFLYQTEDQTAIAGEDYEATSGTLVFEAGEQEQTVFVNLITDEVSDGDKHFLLRLEATEADIADAFGFGVIVDNESPGTRSISEPPVARGLSDTDQSRLSGAQGIVRVNLEWPSDNNDIDVVVVDPCGNEISFGSRLADCEGFTGQLEADNGDAGVTLSAENIFWGEQAPFGEYTVRIIHFAGEPTEYTLRAFWGNESAVIEGAIANGETLDVFTFIYGPQPTSTATPTPSPEPQGLPVGDISFRSIDAVESEAGVIILDSGEAQQGGGLSLQNQAELSSIPGGVYQNAILLGANAQLGGSLNYVDNYDNFLMNVYFNSNLFPDTFTSIFNLEAVLTGQDGNNIFSIIELIAEPQFFGEAEGSGEFALSSIGSPASYQVTVFGRTFLAPYLPGEWGMLTLQVSDSIETEMTEMIIYFNGQELARFETVEYTGFEFDSLFISQSDSATYFDGLTFWKDTLVTQDDLTELFDSLTNVPVPTPTSTPNPQPSPQLSPTPNPTPSALPSPVVTPTVIPSPTATSSPSPTATPTSNPSPSPSASPTLNPSPSPSATPTSNPSPSPTASPTSNPSPSVTPSPAGSPTPSPTPTMDPSVLPTPTVAVYAEDYDPQLQYIASPVTSEATFTGRAPQVSENGFGPRAIPMYPNERALLSGVDFLPSGNSFSFNIFFQSDTSLEANERLSLSFSGREIRLFPTSSGFDAVLSDGLSILLAQENLNITDQWNSLGFVYQERGAQDLLQIYLNGVLAGEQSWSFSDPNDIPVNLYDFVLSVTRPPVFAEVEVQEAVLSSDGQQRKFLVDAIEFWDDQVLNEEQMRLAASRIQADIPTPDVEFYSFNEISGLLGTQIPNTGVDVFSPLNLRQTIPTGNRSGAPNIQAIDIAGQEARSDSGSTNQDVDRFILDFYFLATPGEGTKLEMALSEVDPPFIDWSFLSVVNEPTIGYVVNLFGRQLELPIGNPRSSLWSRLALSYRVQVDVDGVEQGVFDVYSGSGSNNFVGSVVLDNAPSNLLSVVAMRTELQEIAQADNVRLWKNRQFTQDQYDELFGVEETNWEPEEIRAPTGNIFDISLNSRGNGVGIWYVDGQPNLALFDKDGLWQLPFLDISINPTQVSFFNNNQGIALGEVFDQGAREIRAIQYSSFSGWSNPITVLTDQFIGGVSYSNLNLVHDNAGNALALVERTVDDEVFDFSILAIPYNNGQWGQPTPLINTSDLSPGFTSDFNSQIAMSSDGIAAAVWDNPVDSTKEGAVYFRGAWSQVETIVSTPRSSSPKIAIAKRGIGIGAWSQDNQILGVSADIDFGDGGVSLRWLAESALFSLPGETFIDNFDIAINDTGIAAIVTESQSGEAREVDYIILDTNAVDANNNFVVLSQGQLGSELNAPRYPTLDVSANHRGSFAVVWGSLNVTDLFISGGTSSPAIQRDDSVLLNRVEMSQSAQGEAIILYDTLDPQTQGSDVRSVLRQRTFTPFCNSCF